MTGWRKRQVIEMAQEARQGVVIYYNTDEQLEGFFERFAALVREDEREACAKVCEDSFEYAGDDLAQRIRNRGQA